eukprot:scaffold62635_cov74-Phaeocystis_antarctica.AAC.1
MAPPSAPAKVADAAAVTAQACGARAQADLLHRGDCGAVAPGRQVGEGLLRLREEPELALQDRWQVAGWKVRRPAGVAGLRSRRAAARRQRPGLQRRRHPLVYPGWHGPTRDAARHQPDRRALAAAADLSDAARSRTPTHWKHHHERCAAALPERPGGLGSPARAGSGETVERKRR